MLSYPPCRSCLAGQYQHEQSAKHPMLVYPTSKVSNKRIVALKTRYLGWLPSVGNTSNGNRLCWVGEGEPRQESCIFFLCVCMCVEYQWIDILLGRREIKSYLFCYPRSNLSSQLRKAAMCPQAWLNKTTPTNWLGPLSMEFICPCKELTTL